MSLRSPVGSFRSTATELEDGQIHRHHQAADDARSQEHHDHRFKQADDRLASPSSSTSRSKILGCLGQHVNRASPRLLSDGGHLQHHRSGTRPEHCRHGGGERWFRSKLRLLDLARWPADRPRCPRHHRPNRAPRPAAPQPQTWSTAYAVQRAMTDLLCAPPSPNTGSFNSKARSMNMLHRLRDRLQALHQKQYRPPPIRSAEDRSTSFRDRRSSDIAITSLRRRRQVGTEGLENTPLNAGITNSMITVSYDDGHQPPRRAG